MEVKVTKCANGHYYDINKYDACPHCGAAEFVAKNPRKRKFGLFRKGTATPPEQKAESMQFSKEVSTLAEDLICEDVETVGTYGTEQLQADDVETQGVFTASVNPDISVEEQSADSPCVTDGNLTTGFFSKPIDAENSHAGSVVESRPIPSDDDAKTTGVFSMESAAKTKPVSLQEQVNAATDDNDVKTTGFFASPKTAENIEQNIQQLPVGWIVCLTGKHVGKDYCVFAGKNSIGRTDDNAIALLGESSVSREKHAWIIFEPRKQEFYLKSGDESGLVYVNDENVFDVVPLHTGDILELGDVKMVFVALCGEKFSWNDYTTKG